MTSWTPDLNSATILAYDAGAAGYAEHSRDRAHLTPLRERLVGLLPPQSLILDLGSGPGHDTALLAGLGATVVALDPAVGLLGEARSYPALAGRLVNGAAQRLPFADASFDGIWSCAALLHVPHEEVDVALHEALRVLKPGGVAFFSMSEGDSSGPVLVDSLRLATRVYYFYHREAEWAARVRAAGFEIADHRANREAGNFNPGSGAWLETYARRP